MDTSVEIDDTEQNTKHDGTEVSFTKESTPESRLVA